MPHNLLLTINWHRDHVEFYCDQVSSVYTRYWPSAAQADDLILACMGCPL